MRERASWASKPTPLSRSRRSFPYIFTGLLLPPHIGAWLKRLHDDRKLIVHAAAQAQGACDYILNVNLSD
jgi:hypothetical protein